MNPITTSAQIRKADQQMIEAHHFPGLLLMETAGRQCAEWILSNFPSTYIYYVLAGQGNNGGDGLVIARYLHLAGLKVEILLANDPSAFQGDALINWLALSGSGIPVHVWPFEIPSACKSRPDDCLLIDALLGTGLQGELRGNAAEIIAAFRPLNLRTVAIDLPSGLNADTGQQVNAVLQAKATLTFQAVKICHHVHPAAASCGEIVTFDIGIWPKVMAGLGIRRWKLDAALCSNLHKARPSDGHKGTFGHALCVGGSKAYAGAIALTGMAALQVGAGLSTVFTTEAARCAVYQGRPEVMVCAAGDAATQWLDATALPALVACLAGKAAVAIGPGMGNESPSCDFMKGLLQAWNRPLVIDADGLNVLSSEPELWRYVPQGSILTPHPGEMTRLMPGFDIKNCRLEAAEQLAAQKQVIVVLKGAGTIVAMPDGKTYVNTSGNQGMATGGAGDVLTGMLVGLLAQGYAPAAATLLGVYLHGRAGDLAMSAAGASEAVTASDLAKCLGHSTI